MSEPSNPTGIDKDALYGDYRKAVDDRHKLAMKAAHKALDIAPDDDVKIEANKVSNGIGAKGVVGAALAAGLPSAALAAILLLRSGQTPPSIPPPTPAVAPAEPKSVPEPRQDWDAIYEERQPDGTWKQIKRERLKVK